ncbi:FMR1-interacting protein NUFIP1 [Cydia pomonella]|uniref:FMR1-interacting protein NUFIP1 n=1 Tax=Cydia pomonella TaxID=82600 RepID=UPI002ADD90CF|nr:FMR1-interacting protein NUFIP1 [Cydia pomonella]
MEAPFHNAYYNNQRFPAPNRFQWRPHFVPRGPPSGFRAQGLHWRQQTPQDCTNEFWCETCDRGFRTPDILEKHKQQHQKCNIDGCQFIAHPKVITKHIQMQHASGLYKKIAKLQDPEEIRKWREERKKKYPTKENVEKAAAAIKEKIDRGEKMGLKNKRHEKNPNTDSGMGGKRKPFNKHNTGITHFDKDSAHNKRRRMTPKNVVKKLPVAEDTRKLKPFTGIQDLMMDNNDTEEEPSESGFTIEDEDDIEEASNPSETASGSVCLALSSLMCNYGSSDEDENNDAPNITLTKAPKIESDSRPTVISNQASDKQPLTLQNLEKQASQTRNDSDDDSGPEEVKVTKQVTNVTENIEIKSVMNKRKPKDKIPHKAISKRPKPKLPSTLLQKLLFQEMKHERNIVLQCVRHIIRNNFFDKSV